jgi:hypothetical protein
MGQVRFSQGISVESYRDNGMMQRLVLSSQRYFVFNHGGIENGYTLY